MTPDNCCIITVSECSEHVKKHGHSHTVKATCKYPLPSDMRIEFRWGNAGAPEERARCIRGAFHRIKEDLSKEGICSSDFDARYRVV